MPAVKEAVVLEAATAEEGLVGVEGLGTRQGLYGGAGGGRGKGRGREGIFSEMNIGIEHQYDMEWNTNTVWNGTLSTV